MIQKLPVYFPPISNCYSACSGVASILQAYDDHNPALFLNRLYFFRKTNNVLKFAMIERTNEIEALSCSGRRICDILIENFANKDYVFLSLDHYYIKASSNFHLYHFIHDVTLVYGYDSNKRIFYCADNFNYGKYMQAEVSYDEMEDAWGNVPDSGNKEVIVFHYNESMYDSQLDLHKVNLLMQDYIESKYDNVARLNPDFLSDNIFGFNRIQNNTYDTCVFGIKVYDWLLNYLKEADSLDLRPLHLLINHQEILLYLIEYLQRNKKITHVLKYIEILNKQKGNCEIARNMAIKYNVSRNELLHKRLLDMIAKVYIQENAFYECLLCDKQIWE